MTDTDKANRINPSELSNGNWMTSDSVTPSPPTMMQTQCSLFSYLIHKINFTNFLAKDKQKGCRVQAFLVPAYWLAEVVSADSLLQSKHST